jgi:hypothetical protein
LLFPFVEDLDDDVVKTAIEAVMSELPPFKVELSRMALFAKSNCVYLRVDTEPKDIVSVVLTRGKTLSQLLYLHNQNVAANGAQQASGTVSASGRQSRIRAAHLVGTRRRRSAARADADVAGGVARRLVSV